MVDAPEAGSKLFSKSRWKTKILEKTNELSAAATQARSKPAAPSPPPDNDLHDFLKPSTERAQQQKDAAATAFSSRPRIDIARAQRWPGAQEILASAAAGASETRQACSW